MLMTQWSSHRLVTCLILYAWISTNVCDPLSWVSHPQTLPRADRAMAIGYSTTEDLIWLIGGQDNPQQLISFNPNAYGLNSSTPFAYDSTNVLSQPISVVGKRFAQIGDIVYLIDLSQTVSTFNVLSQTFTYNYDDITIPTSVRSAGCSTHFDHYLVITGGQNDKSVYLTTVQIYDLNARVWVLSAKHMHLRRGYHACIVNPNAKYVYVIAGRLTSGYGEGMLTNTVSKLYIGDMDHIDQYNWTALQDTLRAPVRGCRAVMYKDDIFVIGGTDHFNVIVNNVDRILSNDTIIPQTDLPYPIAYTSSIAVDNTLFVFGGQIVYNGKVTSSICYAVLSETAPPTSYPSIGPSEYPTVAPTSHASVRPSVYPTTSPTFSSQPVNLTTTFYESEMLSTDMKSLETLASTANKWLEGSNTGAIDMLTIVLLGVIGVLLLICGVAVYMIFVSNIRDKRKPKKAGHVVNVKDTDVACLVSNQSTKSEEMRRNIVLEHGEGNAAAHIDEDLLVGVNTLQGDELEADDVVGAMNTRGEYNVAEDECVHDTISIMCVVGEDEDNAGLEMYGNEPISTQEGPS
eukprot:438248_1